tara:strand:+ start:161 stop:529 length:369 start_codon:yes stop_codon:yes gene_type:complete
MKKKKQEDPKAPWETVTGYDWDFTGRPIIRYMIYDDLIRLNEKAKKAKYNQSINSEIIKRLSKTNKDGKPRAFPISFAMVHNDTEMRTLVQLDMDASAVGLLDMSFEDYHKLRRHRIEKLGI